MARKPSEFVDHPVPFSTLPTYRAFCHHVVDGDTLDVLVDLGLNHYAYVPLRVQGIDTAEIFKPRSPEERAAGLRAKTFLESMVLGKPVRIVTYKDGETFGRYVADVFFQWSGSVLWASVADELRANGHAWGESAG